MKYEMKLQNDPFNKIKDGSKTIELRLNDEKRRLLKVSDTIVFTNLSTLEKMEVIIKNLYYFNSFEELYKSFSKEEMGYNKEDKASYKDMLEYYSIEEEKKCGVVGIKIKKL